MIQNFTARVLDALDRIYSIVGPVSRVDAIDVAPPILVHDVSREAEFAAGFWATADLSITTAGAGVPVFGELTRAAFLAQTEVAALLSARGLEGTEVDVWIYGLWSIIAAADIGDFGFYKAGCRIGTLTGGGQSRVLKSYTGAEAASIVSGGTSMLTSTLTDEVFGPWTYPFVLPDDVDSAFLITGADDAGGAMTAGSFYRCWVGPKGVLPPGL